MKFILLFLFFICFYNFAYFCPFKNIDMNQKDHIQRLPNTDLFFKMIFVEGGTFDMGNNNSKYDNEKPQHKVILSDFYIGEFLVT
jgi:hypothetical protein